MIVPGICNFLNYNLWFICQKVSQKSRALWTDKRFMRLRSSRRNIKPFISIHYICSIVWQLGNVQMHQVYEIFILWIKLNLKSRTSCFRQRDVTIGLQVKCSSPFSTLLDFSNSNSPIWISKYNFCFPGSIYFNPEESIVLQKREGRPGGRSIC